MGYDAPQPGKEIVGGRFDDAGFLGHKVNNQLIKFDPRAEEYSLETTNGCDPPPRHDFGVAQLNEKIFILGGDGKDGKRLNDFYCLNMDTKCITEIKDCGIPRGVNNHTLSVGSSSELVLVGGRVDGSGRPNEVLIFDVPSETWKRGQKLPREFCEKGLDVHATVEVKRGRRVKKLVVIGGWIDDGKCSDHVLMYDL